MSETEAPLTAEQALALAGRQQQRMDAVALRPVMLILIAWGLAWGIGFMAVWLSRAESPVIAPGAAWAVFGSLLIAAVVTSGVAGARIGRGVRGGDGGFVGGVYGFSWAIAPLAITAMGVAFARAGAEPAVLDLFYPAAYSLVVGMLYIVGAALFRAVPMLFLGGWILLVGTVAPFFGTPNHYLVMSVAAGGGFLAGAVAIAVISTVRPRAARG